ncbi:hypothetical protein M8542_21900 [Amycolatopsis sp. OK19-0408]|uniref:Uncharacterized protein n=1 Tax=Amycolatopsis iheyensis TaxID=2945988 RepID=A0A9X2SM26_9PSEU|nr:hypothetical protein [Amycolatopsis iheyensis]MCR6485486.1 hypothetical protein [Amycolatopsis iheyensis]
MSSTANVRRGAPARPALTPGEARAPRAWTAALQRPAAKIAVAGGLTLAGWLLTGALSGSTAAAAEPATACQHTAASTVEHKGLLSLGHHRGHRDTTCAQQPKDEPETSTTSTTSTTEEQPAAQKQSVQKQSTAKTKSTTDSETTTTTKATQSGGGLLGGLAGGVLNVVGGTLTTVTHTVGAVTTTLSHTVLAPLTQPPADNPDAPVVLPLDDILNPILNGGSNSGGVTVTLPATTTAAVTQTTPAATETAPVQQPAAQPPQQTSRVAVVHLVEHQNTLPAKQEQPRDSGVHASGGGGDSTPGLPGGTSAPSAPAPSAAPGHDGPGGARHPFAVHTDDVTTTQLKLIGASRDHEVDGAGREAALPTTSPD